MNSVYTTLAAVRKELIAENTVDADILFDGIVQVSRRIDDMFQVVVPLFVPYREDRSVPIVGDATNSYDRSLALKTAGGASSPLLALTSVSANNQSLGIGTAVQAYPAGVFPISQLQLIGSAYSSWYGLVSCSDTWGPQNATIGGIWGFHRRYAQAWQAVDTLDGAIDDTVTTLIVADVDGRTPRGQVPRISAGNVLQIGDEWMDVVATDATTNEVTVVRGVNGSTAAAHSDEAAVSVFMVEESIKRAVTRQVAFQYARRGAFNTRRITDFAAEDFPADVLQELNGLLRYYANL